MPKTKWPLNTPEHWQPRGTQVGDSTYADGNGGTLTARQLKMTRKLKGQKPITDEQMKQWKDGPTGGPGQK